MFDVKNLQVAYGQSVVIPDLTFNAAESEIVGIVGRNGMGKTTLFRSLIGMIPTVSGKVTVGTSEITHKPSYKRVAEGVAFVPQGRMIFPYLTVYENLISGVKGRVNEEDVNEIYALFPVLRDMKGRKGGNLSGGQQQQLAIGRALMTKPRVLLLDEPTEASSLPSSKTSHAVSKRSVTSKSSPSSSASRSSASCSTPATALP